MHPLDITAIFHNVMSPRKSLSLLLAAAPPLALGAEPLYTDPVGFVKLGDTSGGSAPAVPANTDVRVTVPLDREILFSGAVSSSSETQIAVQQSPGWAEGTWAPSGDNIYFYAIGSGDESGLRGLISGNSSGSIDATPYTPGDQSSLSTGDKLSIRKAWTVKAFFAGNTIPVGTQVFLYNGTTPGINIPPSIILVWTGSEWRYILGGSGSGNSVILVPGESFLIRSNSTPIANLTIFGDVPKENHRMIIDKLVSEGEQQDTTFGFLSPVPQAIGSLNAGFTPGDQILGYNQAQAGKNKSPDRIIVYTGSQWRGILGVSGTVDTTFFLEPGAGYVYRRATSAPMGPVDWNTPQTFQSTSE